MADKAAIEAGPRYETRPRIPFCADPDTGLVIYVFFYRLKDGYKRSYATNPKVTLMPFQGLDGRRPKTTKIEERAKLFFPPFDKLFCNQDISRSKLAEKIKWAVYETYFAQDELPRDQWRQLHHVTIKEQSSRPESSAGVKRKASAAFQTDEADGPDDADSGGALDDVERAMSMSDDEIITAWEKGTLSYKHFRESSLSTRLSEAYENRGEAITPKTIMRTALELVGSFKRHPTLDSSVYWAKTMEWLKKRAHTESIPTEDEKKPTEVLKKAEAGTVGAANEDMNEQPSDGAHSRLRDLIRSLAGLPERPKIDESPLRKHIRALADSERRRED